MEPLQTKCDTLVRKQLSIAINGRIKLRTQGSSGMRSRGVFGRTCANGHLYSEMIAPSPTRVRGVCDRGMPSVCWVLTFLALLSNHSGPACILRAESAAMRPSGPLNTPTDVHSKYFTRGGTGLYGSSSVSWRSSTSWPPKKSSRRFRSRSLEGFEPPAGLDCTTCMVSQP